MGATSNVRNPQPYSLADRNNRVPFISAHIHLSMIYIKLNLIYNWKVNFFNITGHPNGEDNY